MIDVAFLILNYQSYTDTIRVVKEILNDAFDYYKYMVLVVDNNSPNDSFKILSNEFEGADCVHVIQAGTNGGYAKGNNFGLRYLQHYSPMYVCIINNDIHFSSQTIYCLLKIYQELENPFIISPVQILPSSQKASFYSLIKIPSLLEEIRSYFYFWKLKGHKYFSNTSRPNIQRVEIIPGAFLFLDFKNFQKLGFFDEDTFLFGEEKLLAKKIKDNGFYNYIVLDLNYVHEHSKTINSEASLAKQRKMILEGKLIYADKYRRFPSLSKFLIQLSYFYGAKIMANFVRIVRNTKTDN